MENREFGTRLRELRKQAGISQRELAARVRINFTYLSKIESGAMPPPSEKVILRLAEALNADKDELMALAGKIPADIAQILKNKEALQLLRADRTQKKIRANKGEGTNIMKGLFSYKSLSRVAIPLMLVCAIAASLWFASPTQALQIAITNPTSATPGGTYNFQTKISIEDSELLPIQSVTLKVYNIANPTYYDQYTGLALSSTDYVSYATSGAGTAASIKATPAATWGESAGTGYAFWNNQGYTFVPDPTTGYAYQGGTGTTSITYDIRWTAPSGWPQGNYKIEAKITANSYQFTQTSTFALHAVSYAEPVTGPTGGGAPAAETGVTKVSTAVTSDGRFFRDVTAESTDDKVALDIAKDTIGKTKDGRSLSEISITEMATPPAPPANTSIIGLTYNMGPDGATFAPPITITFTYNPDTVPKGADLTLAVWDGSKWVELTGCTVNPVTHTITAPVSHFTAFTILATLPKEEAVVVEVPPAPAAFSTSDLTVYPAKAQPEEVVTIAVSIANTGGTKGSYTVVLNINGLKEAEKTVTVAAGSSQIVTFSTTREKAGNYSVTVDSLSASFTVEAPAPPIVEEEKPVVEEEEEIPAPTNWALIGGIIAAVVVIVLLVYFLWFRRRTA